MDKQRIDSDRYFLKIASVVAERSTCRRRDVGAVAVRDKYILSTGYNGAPSDMIDCLTLGCLRDERGIPSGQQHEICRAVHAEQNVIIQAAIHGISLVGATIYCTLVPCMICAKMLVNSKIQRYVTSSIDYPNKDFMELFNDTGVVFDLVRTV